jgi:hypothetical protein
MPDLGESDTEYVPLTTGVCSWPGAPSDFGGRGRNALAIYTPSPSVLPGHRERVEIAAGPR